MGPRPLNPTAARRHIDLTNLAVRYGLIVAFALLFAFLSLTRDNFFTAANVRTMLLTSAVTIIVSVPLALVLQSGGVDFSIGSALGLAVVLGGRFMADYGWHPVVASAAVLVILGLVGAFNGLLCARWRLSPVVVTIGMLFLLRGVAFVLSGAETRRGFGRGFSYLGRSRWVVFDIPTPVLIAAVWSAVLLVLWFRTRWGRHAHASGAAEEAASVGGINVPKARHSLYVLTALGAGIGGLIQLSRLNSAPPVTGDNLELEALTAVLLAGVAFSGGLGSAANVITGVLFLTVLGNGLIQYRVDTNWTRVVEGAVLVASAGFQIAIIRAARQQRAAPMAAGGRVEAEPAVTTSRAAGAAADLDLSPTPAGGKLRGPDPETETGPRHGVPALEVSNAAKHFGPTTALEDVSFEVWPGEVVGLLGDNSAGKSTLIKALTGVHRLDRGQIRLFGFEAAFESPSDAQAAGVEAVQQQLGVIPIFDASENLFLGREPVTRIPALCRIGWIDRRRMREVAVAELSKLRVRLADVHAPMSALSGGQQQSVSVARASLWATSVVLLDEPTAALGVKQSAEVHRLIRRLADEGKAVVLVTHDMPQVLEICDRAVVLRHGKVAAVETINEHTHVDRLVAHITGSTSGSESQHAPM